MRIVPLADVPDAIDVLTPALLEYWRFALPDDTLEKRRARLRSHWSRDTLPTAWVALRGDAILGTAALRVTDLPGFDHLTPWLGGVFVLPQYRREGIGTALCKHVETCAGLFGYSRLHLFTLDQQGLYERLGWQYFANAEWGGISAHLMSKAIVV